MKLKNDINGNYWIEGFKEFMLPREDIIFAIRKSQILKKPISLFIPLRTSSNPALKNVRQKEKREKENIVKEFYKKFPEFLI